MQGRKNFMRPEFGDPIVKRELFSVSLWKEKKYDILKEKRRKIIESIDAHKAQLIQE
jgi:hypothetical protein